eukprot:CAMPEP_0196811978 /NCGR_PEP_ID=MMETSP1362-20130617/20169_1 /TAXON_ID=163516 /ORGANISM="Leptocylindrus danicus, Strain CCMP1856" /LENGTH=365 /DNA_ID=CAMNT_0042187393 /DNA_START=284 /DNA_END=1381 /DNA_ORIENTATION=+
MKTVQMGVPQGSDRVVFGTAAIAQATDPFGLLDAAYHKGVRRFDLARTYGSGTSEKIFGEWMTSRCIDRDDVNIITKGGMGDDKYGDPTRNLLTGSVLMGEVEASLNTLGTDRVDMYMFHRDDPRLSVEQFVTWANEIVLAGKASSWGVSNWSFDRFCEAHRYAVSEGLHPPCANSPQLSLAVPQCEIWPTTYSISSQEHESQIDWYENNGVELVCWEVLAKGFMAVPTLWSKEDVDRSTFDKTFEAGTNEWRLQRIQRAYCHLENYRRREAAIKIGEEFGLKLPQVAALYALSVRDNVSIICGFLEPEHIDDMIGLEDLLLVKECVLGDEEQLPISNCIETAKSVTEAAPADAIVDAIVNIGVC